MRLNFFTAVVAGILAANATAITTLDHAASAVVTTEPFELA